MVGADGLTESIHSERAAGAGVPSTERAVLYGCHMLSHGRALEYRQSGPE